MHHHSLNDHQADVSLAESDAVAKKGTAVKPGDFDKILVSILLVAGKFGKDAGLFTIPLVGR